jgi:hypothetical protein
MSKAKMEEARELIRAAHYDEARDILQTVDHPMAREWLQKLEKIDPDTQEYDISADEIKEAQPYETTDSENSPWMQSVKTAQAELDDDPNYEAHVAKVSAQIAKRQRHELLLMVLYPLAVVGFFAVIVKIGLEGQRGNWYPLFYWLGFMVLGLPLRFIVRAGHEGDYRPSLIANVILVLVTLIVFVIVGYGVYLRDVRIYELVLSGSYVSAYLRNIFAPIADKLLLFLYAVVGVALVVFPTNEEFDRFIAAMLRGRSRKYYIK